MEFTDKKQLILINFQQTKFIEFILDRFEVLFNTPEITEFNVRVRKVNKTRALVGYITLNVPLGNDFTTEYKIMKKQGEK